MLCNADPTTPRRITALKTLVALTPAALGAAIGDAKADAVLAFLRRHPEQVMQQAPGPPAVARAKLAQTVAAARRGEAPTPSPITLLSRRRS